MSVSYRSSDFFNYPKKLLIAIFLVKMFNLIAQNLRFQKGCVNTVK